MSTYAYPNPQAIFYQQYNAVRKDEVAGILFALFLGGFGVHHFYLRRTGLGILYLCFCWTGIPAIIGFVECFFMPARVREFNAIQAAAIAASLGIPVPGWPAAGAPPVNVPAPMAMPPAGAIPGPIVAVAPPPTVPALAPVAPPVVCTRCQFANAAGAKFCAGCGQAL